MSAERRVAERYLKSSSEAAPKRVLEAVEDFNSILRDWRVPGGRAKAFGNVGVVIDAGKAGTLYYFDQPGVIGLEDHKVGYVSFGPNPANGKQDVIVRHRDQRFGDVNLSPREFADAWQQVMFAFEKRLRDADYSLQKTDMTSASKVAPLRLAGKRRMKLYHGTTAEAAETIVAHGFDLSFVKPRWRNDWAVSTLSTAQAVEKYMKLGTVILEMTFSGNLVMLSEASKAGEGTKSAREYTERMLSLGIDAATSIEPGAKLVYVYNTNALSNIKILRM